MITPFLRESELIENLRPIFSRHREDISKIITSPFVLWMTFKEYLALSDSELNIDALALRGLLDPNMKRSFCVEALFGLTNLDTIFSMLAALEIDRRGKPEDPSKEILFCNYAPGPSDEVHEGWYDPEKVELERSKIAARVAA